LVALTSHVSPLARWHRLIRRFAATRDYDFAATARLLREYHQWRQRVGLDDDSLGRETGVSRELRKRHTMRLLDPREGRLGSACGQ